MKPPPKVICVQIFPDLREHTTGQFSTNPNFLLATTTTASMIGATNTAQDSKSQPWKSVWPPASGVAQQDMAIPDSLSGDELTNQRAFGSHASNTKGRIVHLTQTMCRCNNSLI